MRRFIRREVGRSAEGTNIVRFTRIPSGETTFWCGFCKFQTMPRHISGEILQHILRLSREGCWQVDIAWITGVMQNVVPKILKRAHQTWSPNQMPQGHHQRISTPRKDRYLPRMMRANMFLSSPRLRGQQIIELSVCTITRRLLAMGYHSRWLARCPRLILVRRRCHRQSRWARRHRVWDMRHCIFTDESRFKLHHTDGRDRVRRRQCEGHIDVCVQGLDGNVGQSVIVWTRFLYGSRCGLGVLDGTMNIQIKICAEYRDMLPRPRLVCQEPGLRPIGRSPGVPDKSSRGLGSMSRYSAQILICFIAYIFSIFNFSVGLVGNLAELPPCTVPPATVHCYQNEAAQCSSDNQISQHALLRGSRKKHSLAFMPQNWWN